MTAVEESQAPAREDASSLTSPLSSMSTLKPEWQRGSRGVVWQRWLADNVFPRAVRPQAISRLAVFGYFAAFLLAVTYQLVIPQGQTHLTHVWAEDGREFLGGAATKPFPLVIFEPYAGYLHMLPRLSAEVVTQLPIGWWAAGVAVAAAVMRAAVALLVFTAAAGHFPSRTLRSVLAAAIVLLPSGNSEGLNNLTNLHWFVIFGAFWALLWRPTTRWQNGLAALALLLAATTSPLGLLLVPLAAARLALPQRRDRVPAFAFILGTAMQIVPLLASTSTRPRQPFDLMQGTVAAAARVPLVMFTGPEMASDLYPKALELNSNFYSWPAVLATIVALAIAVWRIRSGTPAQRFLAITSLCLAAAFIGAQLYMNWSDLLRIDQPSVVLLGQRYSIVPCLFLFSAVLVGLARSPRPSQRYLLAAVRAGVAMIILLGINHQWHSTLGLLRLEGSTWQQNLTAAEQHCADGNSEAVLSLSPSRWSLRLPCEHLAQAG